MKLTPDENKNAGPLGDAWVQLRMAEGDLHKLIPDNSDEMHLIACLWGHLEDVSTLIEMAIHGTTGGDVGNGGDAEDADECADTPQAEANSWLLVPCLACQEDGEDEDYEDDGEEFEPSGFSMDDEGD